MTNPTSAVYELRFTQIPRLAKGGRNPFSPRLFYHYYADHVRVWARPDSLGDQS